MTLGGAAQVAKAHCPNERTLDLDRAVCHFNRPTHVPASRTYIRLSNFYGILTLQKINLSHHSARKKIPQQRRCRS